MFIVLCHLRLAIIYLLLSTLYIIIVSIIIIISSSSSITTISNIPLSVLRSRRCIQVT